MYYLPAREFGARPCSLGWDGAMRLVRRPVLLLALSAAVVAGFAARALAVLRRRLGAHGTKHGDDGVFECATVGSKF